MKSRIPRKQAEELANIRGTFFCHLLSIDVSIAAAWYQRTLVLQFEKRLLELGVMETEQKKKIEEERRIAREKAEKFEREGREYAIQMQKEIDEEARKKREAEKVAEQEAAWERKLQRERESSRD